MRHFWGTTPARRLSGTTTPHATTPTSSVRQHTSMADTAPVTGRCTRSEGVHCLQIGCSAPNHKNKRGIRETTANTTARGRTPYGPLHPLRGATPVMSRCTRSEGVHCLQIGCSAPNHKNKRGICETTADTHKTRPPELAQFDEVLRRRECHTHKAPGARAPGAPAVTPQTAETSQTGARAPGAPAQQQLSQRSTWRRRGRRRR